MVWGGVVRECVPTGGETVRYLSGVGRIEGYIIPSLHCARDGSTHLAYCRPDITHSFVVAATAAAVASSVAPFHPVPDTATQHSPAPPRKLLFSTRAESRAGWVRRSHGRVAGVPPSAAGKPLALAEPGDKSGDRCAPSRPTRLRQNERGAGARAGEQRRGQLPGSEVLRLGG